ncbi:metallo-beta-lactamase family protein [Luteibacter sp. UNC138MFCol5.1]|uniref:MBL fold metallo-hydrolase n=1 Tax=Luteibacter sp. UNC138MFCol5.1 TaxID=1502774 RepID=UPI0008B1A4FC|nr:MBL fold metallo-hydrolase [Luteibacter sp. UNC138MFCol5.1]SEO32041.1 metallo-beta-lactamase family protein [Luteibacter sp. UNC138MFCol5.1]
MIVYACHGAALGVTGSCHLVECGESRVLIDCGLFQGGPDAMDANARGFGFEPRSIDAVLLTHAHLDHCGRLPKLVRDGFTGSVYTTSATRELARIVLLDAASLQEEEARRAAAHGSSARPVSDLADAFRALESFDRVATYDEAIEVAPGIRATFVDAGHILGSASIVLDLDDGKSQRRMVFSGDLGHHGSGILREPRPAPDADVVVMETTYGDRPHRSFEATRAEFYGAVAHTLAARGNVVIPTFALERAQEILYCLHRGVRGGMLPSTLSVFLDSPMAISATEVFRRHGEMFSDRFRDELRREDPFATPHLHFTRSVEESMAINNIEGGAIILAGSGMCTGGRVRHHLRHNLTRSRSSVVFVGYAAEGTLAREIVDGRTSVRIGRHDIPVRAKVWTINGFSAHADAPELLAWLGDARRQRVFLVHGEATRGMAAMRDTLRHRGVSVVCPSFDTACRLA